MSARASLVSRASMSAQPVSLVQCQYNMGILGPRVGGGRRRGGGGGRRRVDRGEEKRKRRANVGCTLFCGRLFFLKCVFRYFFFLGFAHTAVFLTWFQWRVCFLSMQQSTVKVAVGSHSNTHTLTTYRYSVRTRKATGALYPINKSLCSTRMLLFC